MNIELIDPFGRETPDRIDSTIQLSPSLHFGYNVNGSVQGGAAGVNNSTATQSRSKRSNSASTSSDDLEWKAAYHISFNRRGNYLAVGYGSGTVAVFSFLSRSLVALYQQREASNYHFQDGVTSVTWPRRSRTLLSGAAGDKTVVLWDTTHPYGPEECFKGLKIAESIDEVVSEDCEHAATESSVQTQKHGTLVENAIVSADHVNYHLHKPFLPCHSLETTKNTSFIDNGHTQYTFSKENIFLTQYLALMGDEIPVTLVANNHNSENKRAQSDEHNSSSKPCIRQRCPGITFEFPQTVGGSLQINPRIPTGGLAALSNGTLVLFWFHKSAFIVNDNEQDDEIDGNSDDDDNRPNNTPKVIVIPLWNDQSQHFITCAAFDNHGDRAYAATKDGTLLGFFVAEIWKTLDSSVILEKDSSLSSTLAPLQLPRISPHFIISGSSSSAWHLLVSRNGKYIIINSSDGSLRLHSTQKCWDSSTSVHSSENARNEEDDASKECNSSLVSQTPAVTKPLFVFHDVVSKVKFVCCDLSGDGEFVVGGANGDDNKYELYIWNTSTGALVDKLTGSAVQLYSVAWHPTRPFLAVATSDGIIDMWGPIVHWTAFAPNFQPLRRNVVYVEREDEFDVDENGKYLADAGANDIRDNKEEQPVNVTSIEKIPVFASDSENEEDVFEFEIRVANILAERSREQVSD